MDTTTFELDTGQCLTLAVRRGDRLWLRRGQLLAQPRARWLGETLVTREERWCEAQAWVADDGERWQCRALAPTTLVLQRPPGWLCRLAEAIVRAAPARRPPAAPRPTASAASARCAGTPLR